MYFDIVIYKCAGQRVTVESAAGHGGRSHCDEKELVGFLSRVSARHSGHSDADALHRCL